METSDSELTQKTGNEPKSLRSLHSLVTGFKSFGHYCFVPRVRSSQKQWARADLNHRIPGVPDTETHSLSYEPGALTRLSYGPACSATLPPN